MTNGDLTSFQAKALRDTGGFLNGLKPGDALPSERRIAELGGVGRSVVRGMLATLRKKRLVKRSNNRWILLRPVPVPTDLETGSKRQRTKDFLLAELSGGHLRPGDQISELALAKKIGVSTISVREALLEMAPLGLLSKQTHKKWEVATFDDKRIADLREFREMVEVFSLRKLLSKGLTREQRTAFEAIREKSQHFIGQSRPAISEILRIDLAFHRLLLEASGNALIGERAELIYLIIEFQLASPLYTIRLSKLGLGQHLKIIDGILCENRSLAESALIEHLRSAEQTFASIIHRLRPH